MTKKIYLNNILQVLLFLCCISMVLYRFYAIQSILLLITSVLILINNLKSFKLNKKNWSFIIFGLFIFTIYIIDWKNSNSLKKIGESLMLFLIPVISQITFNNKNKILNKNSLLIFYSFCVSLVCIYIIQYYVLNSSHHKYDWYLARFLIEYYLEFHSTYMGVWIGVSILILVDYLLKMRYQFTKSLPIILMILIQISTLLILNTRMALYSIVLILIINSILFLNKKQKIFGLGISILFVTSVLFFTNRYKEDSMFLVKDSIENSPRYPIYYCSLKLIKESFWLGNKPSTLQSKQNDCYQCLQQKDLAEKDTNSHSQYLDFFLKGGLFLFLAFIIMLFYKLKYSFQTKNYLYLSINLFFCFAFITENILSRQYGIFIYFFIDLIFLNFTINETHSNYEREEC